MNVPDIAVVPASLADGAPEWGRVIGLGDTARLALPIGFNGATVRGGWLEVRNRVDARPRRIATLGDVPGPGRSGLQLLRVIDLGLDLDGAVLLASVDTGSAMLRVGSNEIRVKAVTTNVGERVVSSGRLFVTGGV